MEEKFKYGERLRQLRTTNRFSQEEVALGANITTSYYGQIERGTANPTISILEKICEVIGITIVDIFTESDDNPLGIDAFSMKILQQIHGKTDKEKELILTLVKTAIKLRDEKSRE